MLALEIWIDDQRVCLAGADDWSLLVTHITATRQRYDADEDQLDLGIGGMAKDDALGVHHHLRWNGYQLAVGSKVTIKVVETGEPDPPVRRFRSDHEVQESPYSEEEIEEMQRNEWRRLNAKFGK